MELLNPEQFIDLLDRTSSEDADVRSDAESEIRILTSTNIFQYFNLLILTIGSETVSDKIQQLALIFLKNLIIPTVSKPIKEIQNVWMDPSFSTNRGSIKDIMFFLMKGEGMKFNYSCLIIAAIYQIELENWPELFPLLSQILESVESNHHDIEGVYQVYTEMLFMYSDILVRKVARENVESINSLIASIFAVLQCPEFELQIRDKAALLLKKLIECMWQTPIFNGPDQINSLLEIYPQVMPIIEGRSFETMYDILILLAKNYSNNIESIGSRICDYGIQGFACLTAELKCITINFWNRIAKLKVAREIIGENQEKIVNDLESLLVPTEEDTEFEVPYCASTCFGSFAVLFKDEFFNAVSEPIPGMLEGEDWRNAYAALLGIRGLIEIKESDVIFRFIESVMQQIVNLFGSENADLKRLSVAVTTEIITHYPKIVLQSDELLNIAFDYAQHEQEDTPEQFAYSLSLLGKAVKHSNIMFINTKYNDLFEFSKSLLSVEVIEDKQLELYVFDEFEELVQRTTRDFYQPIYTQLSEFVDYILATLHGSDESDEKPFLFRLQNICHTIKVIVASVQLPDEAFSDIIGKLFSVMDEFGVLLSTEIFMIFQSIISALREGNKFVPYADSFMHFVELALGSEIPDLIGVAVEAYGLMLKNLGSSGTHYIGLLPNVVHIFRENASPSFPTVYCRFFKGLKNAISGLGGQFPPELTDEIMEEIYEFITHPIDKRNEGEIETFSEIVPFVLFAIEEIYKSLNKDDLSRFVIFAKKSLFKGLFEKIYQLEAFSDQVLYSFGKCIYSVASALGTKVSIQMKHESIRKMIEMCINSSNEDLRKFAKIKLSKFVE